MASFNKNLSTISDHPNCQKMALVRIPPIGTKCPETVLVTGCSSGLGRALCECLSTVRSPSGTNAYRVFATARKLESIKDLEPKGIETLRLDVSDGTSVKECVDSVVQAAGGVDVVVANAGVLTAAPLIDQSIEQMQSVLDVNVFGVMRLIQAVAPGMISQKRGTIVNIGSVSGLFSTPFAAAYCGSKACLRSMTDCLRMELSPWKINVLHVEAGSFKSSLADNGKEQMFMPAHSLYMGIRTSVESRLYASQNMKGVMSAEDTARQIVKSMIKKNPPFNVSVGGGGGYLRLLGFITKLKPGLLFNLVCKKTGLHDLQKLQQNKS